MIWILFALSVVVTGVMSCEKACTKELSPVCATDGAIFQVFSNECVMNNKHCVDGRVWRKSDLRSCAVFKDVMPALYGHLQADEAIPDCLKVCSMLPLPVCGFNGKTYKLFGNGCAMSNVNCLMNGEEIYEPAAIHLCN